MNWKHLRIWTGVELRRLLPAEAGFVGACAVLLVRLLIHRRDASTYGLSTLGLMTLVLCGGIVLAILLGGVLVADLQGKELAAGTRRHLFALGLRPAELLASKMFAAVLGLAVCDGAFLLAIAVGGLDNIGLHGIVVFGELNLLALVLWAIQLVDVSYPRIGTLIVLATSIVYGVGLAYVPWLALHGNVFQLVTQNIVFGAGAPVPVGGPADLGGATVAAGVFILFGVGLAWIGQRCRVVE